MYRFLILCIFLSSVFSTLQAQTLDVKNQLDLALQQYELMLKEHPNTDKIPHSMYADGSLRDMPSDWWCSGFFGASLWYLYEYSGDARWKEAAHRWTMAVQKEQYTTNTHDLGFMIYYPFGHAYRQTGNEAYKKVLLQGAQSLGTRFNKKVGLMKSWDDYPACDFPVIIDNMMNLEYMIWAARETGNSYLEEMAVSHADKTMANHFRKDKSSYHVVCYDSVGNVVLKKTHQGYSDGSAWARGQAWGLYGYTSMYRLTKKKRYLKQAQGIADFYLSHPRLPADKIPYWDFDAPGIPNEERDVSAAAIVSSALLELSEMVSKKKAAQYRAAAVQMLQSLSTDAYRNKPGELHNFLLRHSVGHKPGGIEVDVPLIYADYYYIEALLRYSRWQASAKK